ncbi:MAG: sulfite exporter TauE/SafE family protein [Planctomycetota bacterium]
MWQAIEVWQVVGIATLGIAAGTLGGMLGVGGSVLMIPGLVVLLGRPTGVEQHLFQASAMVANVAVAVPAAMRHRRAGAMTPAALRGMLPAALGAVVLGVWLSNRPVFAGADGGVWLGRCLAVFLLYVAVVNALKLYPEGARAAAAEVEPRVTTGRGVAVGGLMGTVAGLLGIGGGAIAVPLQQTLMRLELRRCIANSAAVIVVSAAVGAVYKNATLAGSTGGDFGWRDGLTLGLLLAPTAWAGGRLGASLTHRLPRRAIRAAFVALMLVAAWRMAAW